MRLESGDAGAQHGAIAAEAERDTRADVTISANVESVSLSLHKPAKVPGATRAFTQALAEDPNPVDHFYVLLGPWKVTEGTAEPVAPLAGKPHTKVYTLVVSVRGAPQTARALLGKVDLSGLEALLAR